MRKKILPIIEDEYNNKEYNNKEYNNNIKWRAY